MPPINSLRRYSEGITTIMKATLLLVLAILGASYAEHDDAYYRELAARVESNFNDYLDNLIPQMQQYFIEHGVDPLKLPDIIQTFSATDLLGIVWHGELDLTSGWASGLSIFKRSGDALMNYVNKTIEIKAGLEFTDVAIDYNFVATIMDIGPDGNVYGEVRNLIVTADLLADLETLQLTLLNFQIADAGTLTLHVSEMPLAFLVDAIADAITFLFHDQLLGVIETQLREILTKFIGDLDLGSIIGGGSTTAPPQLRRIVHPRFLPMRTFRRAHN